MTRILLSELTDAQRARLCNGCGAKTGGGIKPPDWHSRATCDQHDIDYWVGGLPQDKDFADRELLNGMYRDAAASKWWQRPLMRYQAWCYYLAVCNRAKGFHKGMQRTMADLERLVPRE